MIAEDRGWIGPFASTAGLLNQIIFPQEHGIVGMSAKIALVRDVEPTALNQGHCHGWFHLRINDSTDSDPDLPNLTKLFIPLKTSYRYTASDFANAIISERSYYQRFKYPVMFRRDAAQISGQPRRQPTIRLHIDCLAFTGGETTEDIDLDGDGDLEPTTFIKDWRVEWWCDIATGPGWNQTGELAGRNGESLGGTSAGIDH